MILLKCFFAKSFLALLQPFFEPFPLSILYLSASCSALCAAAFLSLAIFSCFTVLSFFAFVPFFDFFFFDVVLIFLLCFSSFSCRLKNCCCCRRKTRRSRWKSCLCRCRPCRPFLPSAQLMLHSDGHESNAPDLSGAKFCR